MAVTKRTRFEILRRDNHTCQYCGERAPDVVLHVDHVIPVALGGPDKPDNLLTACKDCNSGKASIQPDSPLVEGLAVKAAAYALGMVDKMTRWRAALEQGADFCCEFDDFWNDREYDDQTFDLPIDFESTIQRWFEAGVPMRALQLATMKAHALSWPRGDFPRWRYFCGIIWNQLDESGIDFSLTDDTVKVWIEYEASERAVEAYEYGQKSMMAVA